MADCKLSADGQSLSPTVDSLSFNHPLYLHPSETQGITIIQHVLAGSDNYLIWSRAMRIALRGKHKLGFIDGTCLKDSQDVGLRDQWERCNAVVLSWLLNSLSKDIANSVIFYSQAHLVWKDLQERFEKLPGLEFFLCTVN